MLLRIVVVFMAAACSSSPPVERTPGGATCRVDADCDPGKSCIQWSGMHGEVGYECIIPCHPPDANGAQCPAGMLCDFLPDYVGHFCAPVRD